MQPAPHHSCWKAQLSLEFGAKADRTVVLNRNHSGPLVIQKPFYPEGAPCHIYLLHPPGGLVGGDQLILDTRLRDHSHVLMTTPGAAKFYRSAGAIAQQLQTFHLAKESLLEWLPQETIAFNNTNAATHTKVHLDNGAKFIGWEIICLGRRASGELFNSGRFVQKLELHRETKPVLIERALFEGDSKCLSSPWGLANYPTAGTMIVMPANQHLVTRIKEHVEAEPHELFSVTLMDNVLICRYLGHQAQAAKRLFIKAWNIARPQVQNIAACMPRIWNT
ncbi:MAG: urease accessory protein UreD [Gammaproteobacteria bacterium]|nr:urease accessory protein UreD [Gammaproteobacteria bacterium]